jgi:hypothetical protein
MPPPCDPEVCLHFAHFSWYKLIYRQTVLDLASQPSVPVVVADTGFDLITRLKECIACENQAWIATTCLTTYTTCHHSPHRNPRLLQRRVWNPLDYLPDPPSAVHGTVPDVSSELTAAEKRKRRKVLQGRENRKKKERKTKKNQRDGPPLREEAQKNMPQRLSPSIQIHPQQMPPSRRPVTWASTDVQRPRNQPHWLSF